jgi:hypothetical protein
LVGAADARGQGGAVGTEPPARGPLGHGATWAMGLRWGGAGVQSFDAVQEAADR